MMPNGDPRNGFSYLTLTLMIDSYFVEQLKKWYIQTANRLIFPGFDGTRWAKCVDER